MWRSYQAQCCVCLLSLVKESSQQCQQSSCLKKCRYTMSTNTDSHISACSLSLRLCVLSVHVLQLTCRLCTQLQRLHAATFNSVRCSSGTCISDATVLLYYCCDYIGVSMRMLLRTPLQLPSCICTRLRTCCTACSRSCAGACTAVACCSALYSWICCLQEKRTLL
jgi:hypothetical protein